MLMLILILLRLFFKLWVFVISVWFILLFMFIN